MLLHLLSALIALVPIQRQLLPSPPSAIFSMADVLEKHALWLRTSGTQGMKADLRGTNLEGAEGGRGEVLVGRVVLTGVDLRQADFRDAKLRNVDFTRANLEDTRFDQANLRWAVLANANLRRASFAGANLQSADLRGADLNQVNFAQADLSGADLIGARCVSRPQLAAAVIDTETKLPSFEDCSPQRN
jgi:uncharacterized protein YjbI with pentapeptide repeats